MNYEIPEKMKAWVLGNPGELTLEEKPVPEPKRAEVLIHVDAVAICATDLEIIKNGPPALIQKAFAVTLTDDDSAYLEEPYIPHRIVDAVDHNLADGVMLLDEKK